MKTKVVFVCTGNTCRSPMAEAFFRSYIKDWDKDGKIEVSSAGMVAFENDEANENSVKVMIEKKHDISSHRAKQFTPEMAKEADYIIGLAPGHVEMITETYPEYRDKVYLLGQGVPDPYGGSIEDYEKVRDAIEVLVKILAREIGQEVYNIGI